MIGICFQATFFTVYLSQKYDYYRTGYFDFGSAIQTVWMASEGHFNALALGRPITLIVSVLFLLYPHPQTLVAFQSFWIAIGAVPIFLLARDQLGNQWHAAAFAGLYLMYPALWGVNQYEYHDLALSIPFLAFAIYFYSVRRLPFYVLSLGLALASSPFIVVIAVVLAVSFLIDNYASKSLKHGRYPVLTICLATLFGVYLQIVPQMFSYQLPTLGPSSYTLTGSTLYLNPATLLSQPLASLAYAAQLKAIYLFEILAPVIFLPILALRKFLPALPWVGVVILYSPSVGAGGVGPVYEYSQWSSFLIPFIFIGAIYGFKRIIQSKYFLHQRMMRRGSLLSVMMIISITVAIFSSGLSPLGKPVTFSVGDSSVPTDFNSTSALHGVWPSPVQNYSVLDWFASQIPQNYSILTQNPIGSKLWERIAPVYVFYQPGYKNVNADAILIDTQVQGLCTSCVNTVISSGNYALYLSYPSEGIFLYFRIR